VPVKTAAYNNYTRVTHADGLVDQALVYVVINEVVTDEIRRVTTRSIGWECG